LAIPFVGAATKLGSDDVLKAVILQANHVNGNNRFYPKSVLEKAILAKPKLLGEFWEGIVADPDTTIKPSNASHEISRLYFDGNFLMADIKILETPLGRMLKNMLRDNVDVAFRPMGVVSKGKFSDEHDAFVIGDDYKFCSINAMPADIAAAL